MVFTMNRRTEIERKWLPLSFMEHKPRMNRRLERNAKEKYA